MVGDGLVVIWVIDGGSGWAGGDFCQGLWVVDGGFGLGLWVVDGGFRVDLLEVGGGFRVGLWVVVFLPNQDFWVISGGLCNCTCISCVLRTRKFFFILQEINIEKLVPLHFQVHDHCKMKMFY